MVFKPHLLFENPNSYIFYLLQNKDTPSQLLSEGELLTGAPNRKILKDFKHKQLLQKSPITKIVSIEEGEIRTDDYHVGSRVSTTKRIPHENKSNSESLVRVLFILHVIIL